MAKRRTDSNVQQKPDLPVSGGAGLEVQINWGLITDMLGRDIRSYEQLREYEREIHARYDDRTGDSS